MLIKRKGGEARRSNLQALTTGLAAEVLDRRGFLKRSGLAAGGLAALGSIQPGTMRKAKAADTPPGQGVQIRKNVCTHCSVGCTVTAEVQNGVWVGQEPSWDSPINRGTHCAKGASVRELVHGDRRLKYPMKLVGGQWQKISWDQAIDEIGNKLMDVRKKYGSDSAYFIGSAKYTNESAYLMRKFGAFWGTNNVDHQARICHSTTVAGVANTWGYGAQTNSYNDLRNSKTMIIMGGNPAEAHPISVQHILADRHRSALHPHRRPRDRICAPAPRHRHSGAVGHALAHFREWLGGQGVHQPARLRHGGRPQGSRQVEPGRGRARHGRPG
jgi:formate dehydrogenase major subunit